MDPPPLSFASSSLLTASAVPTTKKDVDATAQQAQAAKSVTLKRRHESAQDEKKGGALNFDDDDDNDDGKDAVEGDEKESDEFNKLTYVSSYSKAKRQRKEDEKKAKEYKPPKPKNNDETKKVIIQFQTTEGKNTGTQLEVPIDISTAQLKELINQLLQNEEGLPYSFFVNEEEILESLEQTIERQKTSTETVVPIIYQPQAVFRVSAVTRCTSTIEGHGDAILSVHFSSDGKNLASGSGDTTVRLWDVGMELPKATLKGHKKWVMAVAWAPNGKYLASGSMDGEIRVWDAETCKMKGKPLLGHKQWITSLAWEPMTTNVECTRFASASKDNTIRIWDIVKQQAILTLAGHTHAVKCIKWGGAGLLYSGSQDRTIKVWDAAHGKLVRTLEGHGHWVNTLSLNTEYALRLGPYDHKGEAPADAKACQLKCKEAYEKALNGGREMLVSGSDDFTCFLWDATANKKPVIRMTGHQQPVNFVLFSPDGRLIASASFDGSVRLWNGSTGKIVTIFRAHVQAVYQVCWSADSRLLCSSSKDSTMKVWDIRTKKLKVDLPGHADEVFAVDWSPDGARVASGGKDKVLKIWRN